MFLHMIRMMFFHIKSVVLNTRLCLIVFMVNLLVVICRIGLVFVIFRVLVLRHLSILPLFRFLMIVLLIKLLSGIILLSLVLSVIISSRVVPCNIVQNIVFNMDALKFKTQFVPRERVSLEVSHPELFEPLPGFTGEHVPSISELIRRLSAGMFVPVFPDGDDIEDQVFDSELQERFDVMDAQDEFRRDSGAGVERKPGDNNDVPNSDVAPLEEPSLNSGGDNAGN